MYVYVLHLAKNHPMTIFAYLIQNAWVPLMYAVKNGHWTIVKTLLESGHIETFVMNKVRYQSYWLEASAI